MGLRIRQRAKFDARKTVGSPGDLADQRGESWK